MGKKFGRKKFIESLEQRLQLSAGLLGDALNYPLGNFNDAGLTLNGGAVDSGASYSNQLQLTDGGASEARSAFTSQQYAVGAFSTNFDVQFSGASTSGFAFAIQGSGANAVGSGAAGADGIGQSVAVEFLATPSGTQLELNVNGVTTGPTAISPSSIDLSNARMLQISMEYDGSTLTVSETDGTTTLTPVTATQTFTNVNIPGTIGTAAYLGFTGADGTTGVTQVLQSWEFADVLPGDSDIGSPGTMGASAYSIGGQYSVTGAGVGAQSSSDQFHFVSENITGDTTMIAQLATPTDGSASGLMIREDGTAGSAFGEVELTSGGAQFVCRSSAGAMATISLPTAASGVEWLKLVRDGPTVSGYLASSPNGSWTLVGTGEVTGPANALAGLAVASGDPSAPVTANFAGVSVVATTPIGIETGNVIPQAETQSIWVNIINQVQSFDTVANQSVPVAVDANGWPTTDFSIPFLFFPIADDAGVYSVSMQANQNPTVSVHGASLSHQSYSAVTGLYTANITMPGSGTVSMVVTNTNGGARNIQINRPGYGTVNTPVFTTQYINYLQSFNPSVIRFMSFTATNSNPQQTWSQRSTPASATQTGTSVLFNYDGSVNQHSAQVGVCWEYAIMLANLLHTDMWINIPGQANDDYVVQLANLIKNGDTVNGVYYPGLSPDLNVYVEYANEVWNPSFEQFTYATNAAVTEVVNDLASGFQSNLNYDNLSLGKNSSGAYLFQPVWQERWAARRLLQISNDFTSVFGQAAVPTRIRPVMADLPSASADANQLAYIAAIFGPPSKYFYSLATAPYAGMSGPNFTTNTLNGGNANPNLSATDVLNNLSGNGYGYEITYDQLYAVAKQYGLQMEGYESGPDFSGFQDTATSKIQAELDPRMTTFLEQYYEAWFAHGGGTTIYEYAGVRDWGQKFGDFQITNSQDTLFNAKEIGYRNVQGMVRPNLAPLSPATLTATASGSVVNVNWGTAVAGATEYRVQASTNSSFSANVLTQISPGGSTNWAFTGLTPGVQYFFRVYAASVAGDSIASKTANATMSGAAPPPASPTNVTATAVSSSTIVVNWLDSTLIESGFIINVATDPGFANIVLTSIAPADATSASVYGLSDLTTYYVEVQAFDGGTSSAVPAAGPVMTLLPAPTAQYDTSETSGNTVFDTGSGVAANGTITGGVTRIAGPFNGGALMFDGSTGYVNLGTPTKLNFQGQITVGAWIKPTSVTKQGDIVTQNYNGIDTPFFLDISNPTTVNFGTNRFNGSSLPNIQATGVSPTALTDGNWHYVAGVYDGQNFKVYIDGVLRGTTADPYGVTFGNLATNIGRGSTDGSGAFAYFNGAIADVDIFGVGLSAPDIAKLSTQPYADSFTGNVSSDFGTAGNWSAGATPGLFTSAVVTNVTAVANAPFTVGSLTISNGGSVQMAAGIGGSTVGALLINRGGTLDLNNNHLFVNYAKGADPISTIAGYIASGYNGGLWNGTGIISTAAASNATSYGLGYADSADPGNPAGLLGNTIDIQYTLLGDADLNGVVNGVDFGIVAANFNKSVNGWDQGDFNYDGADNGVDFGDVSLNFNKSVGSTAAVTNTTNLTNSSTSGGASNAKTAPAPKPNPTPTKTTKRRVSGGH
jgi:hypothetical protein